MRYNLRVIVWHTLKIIKSTLRGTLALFLALVDTLAHVTERLLARVNRWELRYPDRPLVREDPDLLWNSEDPYVSSLKNHSKDTE